MEIVGVLLWIVCCAACYKIALDKNRNAGGWLILGIIFGIFALVVVALLPTLPRQLQI